MIKSQIAEKTSVKNQVKNLFKVNGVGRRKSSVARVWLSSGTGVVMVNNKLYQHYFDTNESRAGVIEPLVICGLLDNFNFKINVQGGGMHSQSDAVRLGIARALVKQDEALRVLLRQHGLLTVDSRIKERKKPGQLGARRKFQFVKR